MTNATVKKVTGGSALACVVAKTRCLARGRSGTAARGHRGPAVLAGGA